MRPNDSGSRFHTSNGTAFSTSPTSSGPASWPPSVGEELKDTDHAMAAEDADSVEEYFKLGYRGARFSFGYGACPNFEGRAKMMERLEPGRIGVDLSEELQLHPEQSTDAFVLYHPEAKYFNV
jgi:5-methyltetrahydrofolate--homocysteine methyltransferase